MGPGWRADERSHPTKHFPFLLLFIAKKQKICIRSDPIHSFLRIISALMYQRYPYVSDVIFDVMRFTIYVLKSEWMGYFR